MMICVQNSGFNSLLERTKQGIFHYISQKHLPRYLNEIGFRWNHRTPEKKVTRKGRKKDRDDCHAGIGTVSLFVKSRARPTSPTVSKWRNLLPHCLLGKRLAAFFLVIEPKRTISLTCE